MALLLCLPMSAVTSVQAADDPTAARFPILHFVVEGNSRLPPESIEAAVYPYMGERKGIEDVEAARLALEQAYIKAGYETVLVDIPEQSVSKGKVRLRVTEGKVDRLRVSGSDYFSLARIRAEVPSLAAGEVPHLPTLRRELKKAGSASPDRRLTPTLRAGRTPGTLEAEIEVEDRLPLHASVELNTRNARGTSLLRTVGSVRYDNLWQRFHSASLQFQISPQAPEQVEVLAGTYVLPLGNWRLVGYGVNVDSESPVSAAGALSVVGSGRIFGLRAVRPLFEEGPGLHSLSLGFDRKSFDQSVVLVGADALNTPISYTPFQARYDVSFPEENGDLLRLALEANFSVRGLGNRQSEFEDKRFLARANYAYLGFEAEYRRELLLGTRARLRFAGQVTESPLISNEQFALGGADSVRGFHESEVLGDDGAFASLELSRLVPTRVDWLAASELTGLAFVDAGNVWIRSALPGTDAETAIAGAGLGMRLSGPDGFRLAFDWAWRVLNPRGLARDSNRLHLTVSHEF